jgi:hypothetical protein
MDSFKRQTAYFANPLEWMPLNCCVVALTTLPRGYRMKASGYAVETMSEAARL